MFIFRSYVLMRLRWACKRPFPRRPIVPLVLVGAMERAAGHGGLRVGRSLGMNEVPGGAVAFRWRQASVR